MGVVRAKEGLSRGRGTGELGTLLFFPGARERHRQLHRIGERVVEPKGAGRGGRGSTPSRLSPRSLFFFAPGFTHVFLALAHELPEVLNSVDLLAQHGTQLPVQLRQRGLRVQHSPKPVRVLGVRPDRRVRAALRDEGRGNVTTTVRKKKKEDRRREGEERATDFKMVPGRARPLSPEEKDPEATATAPLAALTFL